jgi:hypothetical protein
MVDPAGVSAGGEYGYGDPTTVDAPAHLPLDPVFMFIQAGLSVGGYGYGNLDLALDEVGFAFPIFPIEGEPVGEYGYGDLDLALNNEESDSSISPIEIVPAGGYSYPTFDVSDDEVTREHLRTYGIFEDL